MTFEQLIKGIRQDIHTGQFANEQAVSQGIVLPLLTALGWPVHKVQTVYPQYPVGSGRVDFAVCHPPGKAVAIIEVKQTGKSDGAERQLFEYAFHDGVPMLILTDGREWSFFLPAEQGSYGERRVYKLDIVERDTDECITRLTRYMHYDAIVSGTALRAARDDYRHVSRSRQIDSTFPQAWATLLADEDESLLDLLADQVESLCGFKPDLEACARYLRTVPRAAAPSRTTSVSRTVRPVAVPVTSSPPVVSPPRQEKSTTLSPKTGFTFLGQWHDSRNFRDMLQKVFELLMARDATFAERFASLPKHGRSRRYLARTAEELYPHRPDLCRAFSHRFDSGWYLGTNNSRNGAINIIDMACGVAGLKYGKDIILSPGE